MAETVYNQLKHRVMSGTLDLDASDIRAALIGINKTGVNNPDLDTLADIDALNAGATTINANKVALTTKVVTLVDASDWAQAGADTITFPAEAFIALGILFYLRVDGTNANDVPLMFSDTGFGAGVDLTSGGMTYSLPNGWLRGT
jgi:hypothetical protein